MTSACGEARRRSSAASPTSRPSRPAPIAIAGGVLDRADLRERGVRLGARRAEDGHAAQVADVAVALAAGVQRQHLARMPRLVGRRAVHARPHRRQAVVERHPAQLLLLAQPLRELVLRGARARAGDGGRHRRDDRLRRVAQHGELVGPLDRAQHLQDAAGLDEPQAGQRSLQLRDEAVRREGALDGDRRVRQAPRAELLGDDARRLLRGLRGVQQGRDPGPRDLVLPAVHGSADGERVPGLAAPEADRGQVAVGADRVEVAMELAVGAEQVADVVARGRQDDVDRRLVEQRIEPRSIERRVADTGHAARCCHARLTCDLLQGYGRSREGAWRQTGGEGS